MQKVFNVAVDIGRKLPAPAFEVNTNDLKSVKLIITITNGQTLLDLTDKTVRIAIRKPDDHIIFQDCTVKDATNGQVEIILDNQAYIYPGTHTAEIMCYKGSEVVAVSGTFSYKSTKGIMNDEAVESKSEFTTISNMMKDVQETIDDIRENGTGVDAKARQDIQSVTIRLADTSNSVRKVQTNLFPLANRRPLVTFIDDDGAKEVWTKLRPIFESRGVPCTLALISDWVLKETELKKSEIRHLYDVLGWEMVSHTKNHLKLNDLTDPNQVEYELKQSLEDLRSLGYNPEHIVYPFGGHNQTVRSIARKYYKSATDTTFGTNLPPVKQYSLNRMGVGSFTGGKSLADFKAAVDRAKTENSWLIVMTHISQSDAQGVADIQSLVEYVISQNVEIVNYSEGFEVFGNSVFTGDFTGDLENDKYNILTKTGLSVSNQISKSSVKVSTPISSFPLGDTHTSFLNVDQSGFPGGNGQGSGILLTHKDSNPDFGFSYQLFSPYNTTNLYFRKANSAGNWTAFMRIDSDDATREGNLIVAAANAFLSTHTPTNFKDNKITVNMVNNANATGFPTGRGGTLITIEPTTDAAFTKQFYMPYDSDGMFIRRFINNAWSEWIDVGAPKVGKVNSYTATTLASEFPRGVITTFYVNSQGSSGFPTVAGLVTTYTIPLYEAGFARQEFRPYNQNTLWSRYEKTDGTWSAFEKNSVI